MTKNKASGSYSKATVKKQKTVIGILALSLCAILIVVGLGAGLGWFAPVTTPTTPATADATFTLIDYRTGEDVSAWVEISIWTPDADDLPFDEDDAQVITNFDEEISGVDADSVSIDLTSHSVVWCEIDPDFASDFGGYNAVFNPIASRDMRKLPGTGGSVNYDYTLYVYHAPSNVSFAMLNRGPMDATDGQADALPDLGDMAPYNNTFVPLGATSWNRGTDGNYTIFLNAPKYSTDGLHAGVTGGDEWNIDDEEHAAMSQDEVAWLRDQSNFRTIAPLYDLTDDTDDDFVDELEKVTNVFGLRFRMNTTISTTSTDGNYILFEILERDGLEVPAEVIIEGVFVTIVFFEPITVYDGGYNFDVHIDFGAHIFLANATSNRILLPGDDDSTMTATAMNSLAIDLFDQYAA